MASLKGRPKHLLTVDQCRENLAMYMSATR